MALLGIEGGATSSKAILKLENTKEIHLKFGPCNYTLSTREALKQFFEGIRREIETQSECEKTTGNGQIVTEKIAIGLPGVLNEGDRKNVNAAVSEVWPSVKSIWVGNDIEVAFSCLERIDEQQPQPVEKFTKKCLIICGTGSVCFGKTNELNPSTETSTNSSKTMFKVGGNGHIIGDHGSGYSIGLEALRSSMKSFERTKIAPTLLTAIMKYLQLDNITELVSWSVKATKTDIASLAKIVTQQWIDFKDNVATAVITEAVTDLTLDFNALLDNLNSSDNIATHKDENQTEQTKEYARKDKILLGLTGSLLTECPRFSQALTDAIRALQDKGGKSVEIVYKVLKETVNGTLNFIQEAEKDETISMRNNKDGMTSDWVKTVAENWSVNDEENQLRAIVLPTLTALPTTELRNKNSMNLDKMSAVEGVQLMLNEEESIYKEIRKEAENIGKLIVKIAEAFKVGGRLFYVGAGTSGRLGILDASECPPTFKVPLHWVQGIIAGGLTAVVKGVEGAEDSCIGGTLAVKEKEITDRDVVIGIAASGRTPFVWGALYEAKKAGAYTAMITFNPNIRVNLESLDMLLAINVGPEVLTGSTRLKSGTATKSVLNMLTTLSMVRYGKCLENLMIDVMATNEKLKDRAARIVLTILENELPNLTKEQATQSLKNYEFDIKKTVEYFRSK